jgi:hypothetical protein
LKRSEKIGEKKKICLSFEVQSASVNNSDNSAEPVKNDAALKAAIKIKCDHSRVSNNFA